MEVSDYDIVETSLSRQSRCNILKEGSYLCVKDRGKILVMYGIPKQVDLTHESLILGPS